MPLFNFGRGDNFCNTLIQFHSSKLLFPIYFRNRNDFRTIGNMRGPGQLWGGCVTPVTAGHYLQLSLHLRRFLAFHHIPITPHPATISCRSLATSQTRENIRNIFLPFVFWEKMKMHFCGSFIHTVWTENVHRSSVLICRNIYYLLVLMNETFCWTMFLINILINYGYLKCHVEMSFLFIFSIWSKYLSGSQSLDRQEFTHLKSIIIFCQTEGQRICNI